MKVRLIKVYNFKGICIPKRFIKKYQLHGEIDLIPLEAGLLIKSSLRARNGWEDLFKKSLPKRNNTDRSLWQSVPNKFDHHDWSW